MSDSELTAAQRSEFLGEASMLTVVVSTDEVDRAQFHEAFVPVADRHDAYVEGDVDLDETRRRVYLRNTKLLRVLPK